MGQCWNQCATNVVDNPQQISNQFFYLLKDTSKLKLQRKTPIKYLWFDRNVQQTQNRRNLLFFQKQLDIQSFHDPNDLFERIKKIDSNIEIKVLASSSLQNTQVYRNLQSQAKIKEVFIFCSLESAAKLLMSNHNKIKNFAKNRGQVVRLLKSYQSQTPAKIFISHNQSKQINKCYLNFKCLLTNNFHKEGLQDFISASKQLFPSAESQIQQYIIDFTNTNNKNVILKWVFRESFFWNMLNKLPQVTTDTTQLSYLRQPISDLNTVLAQPYQLDNLQQAYLLLNISQHFMLQNQAIIIFPSFMRGFINKNDAMEQFQNDQSLSLIKVEINQTQGIYVNKECQKILFHPLLYYLVQSYDKNSRLGAIKLFSLANINKKSQKSQKQIQLSIKIDYLDELAEKSQGQIIALFETNKPQAAIWLEKKSNLLKQLNASNQKKDRNNILIGDLQFSRKNQFDALSMYQSVTQKKYKTIAMVHELAVYLSRRQMESFIETQQKINLQKQQLKKHSIKQYYYFQFYRARVQIFQQNFEEALKIINKTLNDVKVSQAPRFQGLPLVHELMKGKLICQRSLKSANQKQTQKQLKKWFKICTDQELLQQALAPFVGDQQIIKSIYKLSRNSVQQSNNSKNIPENNSQQQLYDSIKQSKVCVRIPKQQSLFQNTKKKMQRNSVQINQKKEQKKQKDSLNNIEQSTVGVNYAVLKNAQPTVNPMKNIDQRSVNVVYAGLKIPETNKNPHLLNIQQSPVNVNYAKLKNQDIMKTDPLKNIEQSSVNVVYRQKISEKQNSNLAFKNIQQSSINVNLKGQN